MKSILFDTYNGQILGLQDSKVKDWYPLEDDAYLKIIGNNGKYVLDIERIKRLVPKVITIDYVVDTKHDAKKAIVAKVYKNNLHKKLFIDNGVTYEGIKLPYAYEDRLMYIEGMLAFKNTDDPTQLKVLLNTEYGCVQVDFDTFKIIYDMQKVNVYKHEKRAINLNDYVESLTDYDTINIMNYENAIPEEFNNDIPTLQEVKIKHESRTERRERLRQERIAERQAKQEQRHRQKSKDPTIIQPPEGSEFIEDELVRRDDSESI